MRWVLLLSTGCLDWDKANSVVIQDDCSTVNCDDTSDPEIIQDSGDVGEPAVEPGNPPDTGDSGDTNEPDANFSDDDGDGLRCGSGAHHEAEQDGENQFDAGHGKARIPEV